MIQIMSEKQQKSRQIFSCIYSSICHKIASMKRKISCVSLTLVLFIVSMWTIIFFLPLPPLLTGISYSRVVYDDHHELLRLTLSKDSKYRLFTPLSALPSQFVAATLLQEDQY